MMRQFTNVEKARIRLLIDREIDFTLIQPTATGLKKSILDATHRVRQYLVKHELHDYKNQKQGPYHKKYLPFYYLSKSMKKYKASLYRPLTKKGDPRIWFEHFREYSQPDDIIVIIGIKSVLYLINLTQERLEDLSKDKNSNVYKIVFKHFSKKESPIALELLGKLKEISVSGPHLTINPSDTGVGATLEKLLGLPINSSKKPDYKGIELKSYREFGSSNRMNLFAQVADWSISKYKSSKEVLDEFGYNRDGNFKLNCTISTIVRNSQGLKFFLKDNVNYLIENSDKKDIGDFLKWDVSFLHQRLIEKHPETFWIKAKNIKRKSREYFHYTNIIHTSNPLIEQFDLLLSQGDITMDHLIKRTKTGGTKERGPLFKINKNSVGLLFQSYLEHNLN